VLNTGSQAAATLRMLLMLGAAGFFYNKSQELARYRRKQQQKEMKAKYGVRLVGISGTVEISSTDAMQQRLRSSKNLVKYYNAETGVLHQRSHEEEQSYRIQHFQTGIGNVWKPYADLGEDFEFDFANTVGQKLRYVPIVCQVRGFRLRCVTAWHHSGTAQRVPS
jgi:hypothetical protein